MSGKWRGPKRLFKARPAAPEFTPEMAADMEKLRRARQVIDPFRTYRMRMPDGGVFEATGADLIATGEATTALIDSIHRGDDPRVVAAAFARLDRTL
jgi:hypothetical protein